MGTFYGIRHGNKITRFPRLDTFFVSHSLQVFRRKFSDMEYRVEGERVPVNRISKLIGDVK